MSGEVLLVCRGHYVALVARHKVADFLAYSLGSCQMVGCHKPSFRRVLVNGEVSPFVGLSPSGELVEGF